MTWEEILWNSTFEKEYEETFEDEERREKQEKLEVELERYHLLTEEEACIFYNVDSKAEALPFIYDFYA